MTTKEKIYEALLGLTSSYDEGNIGNCGIYGEEQVIEKIQQILQQETEELRNEIRE